MHEAEELGEIHFHQIFVLNDHYHKLLDKVNEYPNHNRMGTIKPEEDVPMNIWPLNVVPVNEVLNTGVPINEGPVNEVPVLVEVVVVNEVLLEEVQADKELVKEVPV